ERPGQRRPQRPARPAPVAREQVDEGERRGHAQQEHDALVPAWEDGVDGGGGGQARYHAAGDQRPALAAVPAVDRVEREGDAEEERRPGEGVGRERHEADDEQGRPDELVAFFEGVLGASAGWLFLIGMALTFFALTRLEVEPQPWAIWPAAGLALLALFGFMDGRGGWVLPLLLIAAGAVMLLRDEGLFGISVKVKRSGPRQADEPPAAPTVDVEPPPPAPQPPAADGDRGAGTGQA